MSGIGANVDWLEVGRKTEGKNSLSQGVTPFEEGEVGSIAFPTAPVPNKVFFTTEQYLAQILISTLFPKEFLSYQFNFLPSTSPVYSPVPGSMSLCGGVCSMDDRLPNSFVIDSTVIGSLIRHPKGICLVSVLLLPKVIPARSAAGGAGRV